MIVVSSGEPVYLVVVLQGLLLWWVPSMAEAGTAIRIQPPQYRCGCEEIAACNRLASGNH